LSFSEPVNIEGVSLRSDNEDLIGVVTIRDEQDVSALTKARQIAEIITYSLIILGFHVEVFSVGCFWW
jgi:hypothetical protein